MINNDTFEEQLVEKLIESLIEQPDDWKASLWGLERKSDKLEIKFSFIGPSVSIYKPHAYEFKSKKCHAQLAKVVCEIKKVDLDSWSQQQNEKKKIEEEKAKDKLSDIFDINRTKINRKRKLEEIEKNNKKWYKFW